MSFDILRTEIMARLTALTGTGQPLVAAYANHRADPAGYPYATFQPVALRSEMITNTDVKYEYEFKILIHSEMPKGGRDNAVDIVANAADIISAAFDSDYTTPGIDFIIPMNANLGQYVGPNGPVEYVEFTCVGVVETQRL